MRTSQLADEIAAAKAAEQVKFDPTWQQWRWRPGCIAKPLILNLRPCTAHKRIPPAHWWRKDELSPQHGIRLGSSSSKCISTALMLSVWRLSPTSSPTAALTLTPTSTWCGWAVKKRSLERLGDTWSCLRRATSTSEGDSQSQTSRGPGIQDGQDPGLAAPVTPISLLVAGGGAGSSGPHRPADGAGGSGEGGGTGGGGAAFPAPDKVQSWLALASINSTSWSTVKAFVPSLVASVVCG